MGKVLPFPLTRIDVAGPDRWRDEWDVHVINGPTDVPAIKTFWKEHLAADYIDRLQERLGCVVRLLPEPEGKAVIHD